MPKLLATSKFGAVIKRPRRRIGEISREVQQELNRMTKPERAALKIRAACKLLT